MKFQPVSMLPEDQELTPDLEWMLQSNQVSADILASELTRAHFQDVYRLGLLILDNPDQAVYLALDALLAASAGAYRFPGGCSARVWVFRQAAHLIRRWLRRRQWRRLGGGLAFLLGPEPPSVSEPASPLEAAIWLGFDELPDAQRLAAGLHWGLGLPPAEVALILERPEPQIAGLLELARRRMLGHLPAFELDPGDWTGQELDQAVRAALDQRCGRLHAEGIEIETLVVEAAEQAGLQTSRHSRSIRLKEFTWLGIAALLILLLLWLLNLLLPEQELNGPGSEPPATQQPASLIIPIYPSWLTISQISENHSRASDSPGAHPLQKLEKQGSRGNDLPPGEQAAIGPIGADC